MAELSPGEKRALQYWGVIESATLAGANTQELWQRINDQAAALGYESAGVSARDVARMRSQAVGIRNAANTLAGLGPHDRIDSGAIGNAPWARDIRGQNTVPLWQVKFEHTVIREGEQVTEYRTSVFTGSIPRTRHELELQLSQDAAGLADSYGVEDAGVGDYFIMAM